MKTLLYILPLLALFLVSANAQEQPQHETETSEWFFAHRHLYPFHPHPHLLPFHPHPFFAHPHFKGFPHQTPPPTSSPTTETTYDDMEIQEQSETEVNTPEWFLPYRHFYPFHPHPHYYLPFRPHPFFAHPHFKGFPHQSPSPTSSPTAEVAYDDMEVQEQAQPETEDSTPEWFFPHRHVYPFHPHPHPHYLPFHPHPFFPHPHFKGFSHQSPPPTSSPTTENAYEDMELKFPSVPLVNKGRKECFKAVHSQAMVSCLSDVHSFLLTNKMKVGSKCCNALEKIEDACQPIVKHPLSILTNIISNHCSAHNAPAPSPSS